MMHSVENRFIAIVCGAVLVFVAPLIALFLTLSSERVARERLDHTQVLMRTGAEALGKPLWDFDTDGIRQIAKALAAGENVMAVHIGDSLGTISVRIPETPPRIDAGDYTVLSNEVRYTSQDGERIVGRVEMWVEEPGLVSRFSRDEIAVFLILVVAVAIVFIAAIVSNRVTVIRPLMRLTAAIEATRRLGSRHRSTGHRTTKWARSPITSTRCRSVSNGKVRS